MASSILSLPVYQKIVDVLEDPQGIPLLLLQPDQALIDSLTATQRHRWLTMCQYYSRALKDNDVEDDENSDDGGDGEDDEDGGRGPAKAGTKRKRTSKGGSQDDWASFSKYKKMALPARHCRSMEKHRSLPIGFMNENGLVHEISKVKEDTPTAERDGILANIRYAFRMEDLKSKNQIRTYFQMLFFYQLAQLKRPGGSGRIGAVMQREIWELLMDDNGKSILPLEDLRQLSSFSTQGAKLHEFVQVFGIGCLFYLEDVLTDHFLRRRCTKGGENRAKAIAHLHSLGLKEEAQNSGANEFGEGLLSSMIRPCRAAHFKRLLANAPPTQQEE